MKLRTSLTLDLMGELREAAEAEAIRVFARNLKDLLLAAPAGGKATMGLDPGIRTGVKVAVVDGTGKVLETDTVYPVPAEERPARRQVALGTLIGKHGVELISIGNGTASRETEKMVADILAVLPGEKPAQGDRQRGGGLGLLRLRAGREGVSGARRLAARGGLHRPAPAGPPGRTGEDRPEGDRCRPVSA